jgi:lysophospholipase L1-like esterase
MLEIDMRSSLLALFFLAFVPLSKADEFFFKKGDKVVFLGDSITEQYQYSSYIELYLTTRFPDWNMTFLNAGISGDTANGGAARFKSHIVEEKPTVVTINFGMNDGGYGAFDKNRNDQYVKNTIAMLEMAKKEKIRVGLISPNAVDPRIQERFKLYLETQKQFYAPLKEIAAKNDAAFIDQYASTRTVLEKLAETGAKDVKPLYDGFHTASPGGLMMAYSILTGMKAPTLVSDVMIKVNSKESDTRDCKIEKVEIKANSISFERTDMAIPLPVQKDWVSLLPYLSDLKDLNYYGLKVEGLDKGKYVLTMDGKKIGQYSNEELAAGVNLGNVMTGPIYEQSQKVLQAVNAKNMLVHQRFRNVLMANLSFPDWAAELREPFNAKKTKELQTRKEKIDQLQAEIYAMVKPTMHSFKLELGE